MLHRNIGEFILALAKSSESLAMFFLFFPFGAQPAGRPAPKSLALPRTLPMLPVARSASRDAAARGSDLFNALPQAAELAGDLLRRTLAMLTSSLTALGSRTSALFAHISAALAFDRAAREAASFFNMGWLFPGLKPQNCFGASALFAPLEQYSPRTGWQGFTATAPAANPFDFFTGALEMWAKAWMPAAAPLRTATYKVPASATAAGALPLFFWGFRVP
jgi:hypothetical protein